MYCEEMFEKIREELTLKFKSIKLKDFEAYHVWATPHYDLIKSLLEISKLEAPKSKTVVIDEEVKEKETPADEPDESTESVIPEDYPIGHTFMISKKAYGAVIETLSYPIPEEVVRAKGIENGNKVKITARIGYFADRSPKWDFEVSDHTVVENPNLIEVTQAIVEDAAFRLQITKTVGGNPIVIDGEEVILYINDKDRYRNNLKEGDIIDGRFYVNNTGSFRVTRKHDTESDGESLSIEARRLMYRQNNTTETESGLSMMDRLDKTPFLGKKLLFVGLDARVNDFKETLKGVEEIDLVHLTGDEPKPTMLSYIREADYVLISTIKNSHDTSKFVAKTCNELIKPCTYTHADALTQLLMDTAELIRFTESNQKIINVIQ